MISAIILGINEGPFNNIISHFASTTIAVILFVSAFNFVKKKQWKTIYKIISVFITLSIPMFLHSIYNQYANISVANNNQQFEYLVTIGRYLQNNTMLVNQAIFGVDVLLPLQGHNKSLGLPF